MLSSPPPPPRPGEVTTPAPTAGPSTEGPTNNASTAAELSFEDKPLRISEGGLDFGLVALALLGLLTFFPLCVK